MKSFSSLLLLGALVLSAHLASAQTKPAAKPAPKPAVGAKPAAPKPATAAKPAAAKPAAPAASKAAAAPAAKAEVAAAPPALISDKLAPETSTTGPLKLRLDTNPITKKMQVRTNANGPTRVEVNDESGRPVVTKDMVAGNDVATIDISQLPAGYYIIKCTSGERTGMKRVLLGQ